MPSSSHRRRRCRKKASSSAPPEASSRDWAALPRDILVDVFLRLGPCQEIMRGADCVCSSWRCVAVEEPLLWRHIDIAMVPQWCPEGRAAVDRSAGQCEAFAGAVDDDSLLYLVEKYVSTALFFFFIIT
ncbi:hypothetical protein PR202_gb28572 [Eleusine coracana subsp. coracana]|uniref:F-box domain-containing protein n=1 Tax=Eleusine coracana subsp. coracana TaxID=191504 RepID=A0AAV5FZ62_ELECO|nr:hypothetical protein QOZ80_8BG0648150 [Eleusine coracana subsp. coracana]GJN39451.1 hypothetical protein PR202_gb28572 [Eleusine coracana subsp. coracana]